MTGFRAPSVAAGLASAPDAVHGLFDDHGRLLPAEDDVVYSRIDRRYFRVAQPEIDFAAVHARAERHLGAAGLEPWITRSEFEDRCVGLRTAMLGSPETAGLFSGVHVPFLLPSLCARADMGEELEAGLLDAVGKSYVESFPAYEFRNYLRGQLNGQLSVVSGVRYERLVEEHSSRILAGWCFPTALAGYAVPDQRKVIRRLPDDLILSGPLETAMALVGSPSLLMQRANYPSLLALTAVQPRDARFFHFFEAYGWNLTYNQRSMVGAVSEYVSGGLTIFI